MTELDRGTFAALGEETRYAIVRVLRERGELSPLELSKILEQYTTVWHHLQILKEQGLVYSRDVDARRTVYGLNLEAIERIKEWTSLFQSS
jgi:DNA-binding transcriptional ArsR family regulator